MARSFARISVMRCMEEDWRALTLEQQAVYDLLLSHPKLRLCGAIDVKLSVWARMAAGLTVARLGELLDELEEAGWVAWDRDCDELLLTRFVDEDKVLQNVNLAKGMWNAWETLESQELQILLVENLPDLAFEERFEPPESALRNHRSNHRSQRQSEPPIEPPHPHPQPQLHPSSADRSNRRWTTTTTTEPHTGPTVTPRDTEPIL